MSSNRVCLFSLFKIAGNAHHDFSLSLSPNNHALTGIPAIKIMINQVKCFYYVDSVRGGEYAYTPCFICILYTDY